jgi:hypothetical protein
VLKLEPLAIMKLCLGSGPGARSTAIKRYHSNKLPDTGQPQNLAQFLFWNQAQINLSESMYSFLLGYKTSPLEGNVVRLPQFTGVNLNHSLPT